MQPCFITDQKAYQQAKFHQNIYILTVDIELGQSAKIPLASNQCNHRRNIH